MAEPELQLHVWTRQAERAAERRRFQVAHERARRQIEPQRCASCGGEMGKPLADGRACMNYFHQWAAERAQQGQK